MFEKLIEVLSSLVKELKRYNDRRDATAPVEATPPKEEVTPPKATPVATAAKATAPAAKPAPAAKAAPKAAEITLAETQELAVDFTSTPGLGRDKLVPFLKSLGVPGVDNGSGKIVYKVSNAKDDPALMAKVHAGLKEAIGNGSIDASDDEDPSA